MTKNTHLLNKYFFNFSLYWWNSFCIVLSSVFEKQFFKVLKNIMPYLTDISWLDYDHQGTF